MISQEEFIKNINEILDENQIENIKIDNIGIIRDIATDKTMNKKLYEGFSYNYSEMFGNENSFTMLKIQDMLYRLNLLINDSIIDYNEINEYEDIKDIVKNLIDNRSIELYDAVSYDSSDYDIIIDNNIAINNVLLKNRI